MSRAVMCVKVQLLICKYEVVVMLGMVGRAHDTGFSVFDTRKRFEGALLRRLEMEAGVHP